MPRIIELSLEEYSSKGNTPPKDGWRWLLAIQPETLQAKFVKQHSDGYVPNIRGDEDLFPLSMIRERDDDFIEGGDWLIASTPEIHKHDGRYRSYWLWWKELGEINLDIQRAREFLQMGREDFEIACEIDNDYATCFFAQQSSEKHLKAYLAFHGKKVPRTHDIERLISLCGEILPDFASIKENASVLAPYGVEIRYTSIKLKAETQIGLVVGACVHITNYVRTLLSDSLPLIQLKWHS